ncbi:MAG: c-type cytochrome [Candidatus Eremiobacteraeota bacterium]|nr:c-type cytochrome [Candidatus Eremiobacteraeota bacterium]
MRNSFWAFLASVVVVFAAVTLLGRVPSSAQPSPSTAQIDHGKYIVTQLSMCMDCHGENLSGGPLPFKPAGPLPKGMTFMTAAPNLIEITRNTPPDQLAKFLMTGVGPFGKPANPPMPQYRMNADDAAAVVAYLRSVAGAK